MLMRLALGVGIAAALASCAIHNSQSVVIGRRTPPITWTGVVASYDGTTLVLTADPPGQVLTATRVIVTPR
jgi:hypothetical protein